MCTNNDLWWLLATTGYYPLDNLPFGLDGDGGGGKAVARGFALLFLELLRGTSRIEPVGKLPLTVLREKRWQEIGKR